MEQLNIVGMVVYYRPLHHRKMRKSKVLSSVALMELDIPNSKDGSIAFKNTGKILITLESGDRIFENECYFESPTEVASS